MLLYMFQKEVYLLNSKHYLKLNWIMEEKSSLVKWAMTYGLIFGIYWSIKYIFFILGVQSPTLLVIYLLLTIAVPFIAYYFTQKYKNEGLDGEISFFHAWRFGIMLYFFAALIVSLVHFIFYQYIAPPDFISKALQQSVNVLQQTDPNNSIIGTLNTLPIPSPIQMAVQGIFNNIFYGILLSIPVALIVSRKKTGITEEIKKVN